MISSANKLRAIIVGLTAIVFTCGVAFAQSTKPSPRTKLTYSELLASATPADWRALDLENTLYMDLPTGRVVIELSAAYAPAHADNIRVLVREGYFDGLAILRSQDNYVVQWGDPEAENTEPGKARAMKHGKKTLIPEYTRSLDSKLPFTRLPDIDGYAPQVGFSNSFPVGRNPKTNQTWLAHCYGMVGAGRDNDDNSGSGAELYVVTGHAPRHLDRNIAVLGRVAANQIDSRCRRCSRSRAHQSRSNPHRHQAVYDDCRSLAQSRRCLVQGTGGSY
jgi:cyclophilin family peptidyl-prolyl cis-trans isomerase